MQRTGAEIVWEVLKREGVEVVFGVPGGAIMPTYDLRAAYGIRHILMRHEQAAAHAADGYARVTGRVGVAMATSGPGATNLTTGIANAMLDSIPIVCITGQVNVDLLGTDAFQEADITGIALPITKHAYLVTDVNELGATLHEAFAVARSGRPGPVLVDLPKDVQVSSGEYTPPGSSFSDAEPSSRTCEPAPDEIIHRIAEMIGSAKRPVILCGHGVVGSRSGPVLLELAEQADLPTTVTLLGKSGFPEEHPLALGMMGMHGTVAANFAIQRADLLVALGMRFDDRVTGHLDAYAPDARKIHVDIDEVELGKLVSVDLEVHADVADVLTRLAGCVRSQERPLWRQRIQTWQDEDAQRIQSSSKHADQESLTAPAVMRKVFDVTGGGSTLVVDVGQCQMWAAQFYSATSGKPFITSGGLGTMGFALPAAIGVQIAHPEEEVWVIAGDGGFQMSLHDLATVIQEGLPLRIAVFNNGYLGMVRQWQEMFYDARYEATPLLNPDFVKLAEAYGIKAARATTPEQADDVIAQARGCSGPILMEFCVIGEGPQGNVYPMVSAGCALDDMIQQPVLTSCVKEAQR